MKIVLNQNEASFKQLSKDFLTSCKAKGLSDRTLQSNENHLKCISNFLDTDRPISSFQKKDIDIIIVSMRDRSIQAFVEGNVNTYIVKRNLFKKDSSSTKLIILLVGILENVTASKPFCY